MNRFSTVASVALVYLLVCASGVSKAQKLLTKEALMKIGAKQIECTVVSAGAYNFVATGPDGKEINFATDSSSIQFIPPTERLVVGDKISVVYIEALSPSKSADKTNAFMVEWVKQVPRDFLSGDITCIVTPLEYRNGRTCYVDSLKEVIRFEGKSYGGDYSPFPGGPITIRLKAVPADIGNGYVYQAEHPGPVNKFK